MAVIAVITADIITSRNIRQEKLEMRLQAIAKEIEAKLFRRKKTFEFFRGDSFQAIVEPALAVKIMLLWRAAVMATKDRQPWNIRIAAGIGNYEYKGSKIATSSGTAFEFSGSMLDELKKSTQNIGFRSKDDGWNTLMSAECHLADALISHWTLNSAEAVYYQHLYEETQEQLATRLHLTQSAVHKRLQTASWNALRKWEESFRKQTLSYLK